MKYLVFAFLLVFATATTEPDFKKDEKIRIMVNKISPYSNPTESYRYYDLPFCAPETTFEEPQSIGEKLSGDRKMNSLYEAAFENAQKKKTLCSKKLTPEQTEKFREAIRQNYIFEMFVEDFPVGNYIGVYKDGKTLLARHLNFNILYNKELGKIIKVSVDYEDPADTIDITATDKTYDINFTYSVNWGQTNLASPHVNKGAESFFIDEVHWFSFLNAFVLTSFMIIIVWMILQRVAKSETSTGTGADLESDRKDEDFNWKVIRVEVFRCPSHRYTLCAFVGSGTQLVLMVLILFLLGVVGMYYEHRGSIITAGILLYALTAIISGLVSARFYKYLGGTHWALNIILTASIFPASAFIVAMLLNNIAWAVNSTAALPFSSVMFVIFIWALVTLPLTVLGGITGRVRTDETLNDVGGKLPKMARVIPPLPFYHKPWFTILMAGLLPFSAMNVELYYAFSAIWGHKMYTMYGMVFMMFIMMLNMTACISITLTYFQLNALDYRWWWRSFFYGGSSGIFVFIYAIYFYLTKTQMHGFLQVMYFFGYSGLFSLAVFLMMGSVGFLSSSAFVRHIYVRSKTD